MMQQMQSSIISDFNKIKSDITSVNYRVSTCEANINKHECALYDSGSIINYKLKELAQSIERLSEQTLQMKLHMNMLETVINDLQTRYECDSNALRPETNVAPVEPKEKSDLEIFEQNIDDSIKNNYIDLDDIANGKELWEPYDANWWNR